MEPNLGKFLLSSDLQLLTVRIHVQAYAYFFAIVSPFSKVKCSLTEWDNTTRDCMNESVESSCSLFSHQVDSGVRSPINGKALQSQKINVASGPKKVNYPIVVR